MTTAGTFIAGTSGFAPGPEITSRVGSRHLRAVSSAMRDSTFAALVSSPAGPRAARVVAFSLGMRHGFRAPDDRSAWLRADARLAATLTSGGCSRAVRARSASEAKPSPSSRPPAADPRTFPEKLGALAPPPRAHLVPYNRILDADAGYRDALVPRPTPPRGPLRCPRAGPPPPDDNDDARRRRLPWAELLLRVFRIDARECPIAVPDGG